ncbi:hypothetical protein DFJ74DRAFT_376089 [Hyaloraphidium curvatum]|nr:hypothetical protein DFJ74DRAFT_376089 [Hyaloraphidium curvatum]
MRCRPCSQSAGRVSALNSALNSARAVLVETSAPAGSVENPKSFSHSPQQLRSRDEHRRPRRSARPRSPGGAARRRPVRPRARGRRARRRGRAARVVRRRGPRSAGKEARADGGRPACPRRGRACRCHDHRSAADLRWLVCPAVGHCHRHLARQRGARQRGSLRAPFFGPLRRPLRRHCPRGSPGRAGPGSQRVGHLRRAAGLASGRTCSHDAVASANCQAGYRSNEGGARGRAGQA